MGLTTALAGIATLAGIGGVAAAAPAAAIPATAIPASLASVSLAAPAAATPAASTAAPGSLRCDDGPWRGPDGININGRPDRLDAGDRGGVYIWHADTGWHLRTTDVQNTAHQYTGTIALSPGARFTSFATVRLENGDRVWVDGDNVLHYSFTTYGGVDGVNWTVSACGGARDDETLRFSLDINGHEDDPSRIYLGDAKQHPNAASFAATREV